jgi:hypothetical protein
MQGTKTIDIIYKMQGTKTGIYCEKYARHKKTITGERVHIDIQGTKDYNIQKEYRKVVS